MARKVWRDNEAGAWGAGKGMWAKSGSSWVAVKKAWTNNGGTWTQFWPPDMAFTSFSVTATTGEVAYTTSNISWTIDTSVPGTVTIQRLAPGGSWTDWITGLGVSGTTNQTLAPPQGASGTWTYRAKFVPTHEPTWLTYSSTDTVSLTVPSITFSVTATTGEVYYTSSTMSWTTTSSLGGSVSLQRKLGSGGTWTTFSTTNPKTDSASIQLAPAGTANNGTWYYRAVFIPTVDSGWFTYSSEDSATLSYRSKAALPSIGVHNYERENNEDSYWCWGSLYAYDTPRLAFDTPSTLTDAAILSSISVQFLNVTRKYVWRVGTLQEAVAYTDNNGSVGYTSWNYQWDGYMASLYSGSSWGTILYDAYWENGKGAAPGSPTANYGYTNIATLRIKIVYTDGQEVIVDKSNVPWSGTGFVH